MSKTAIQQVAAALRYDKTMCCDEHAKAVTDSDRQAASAAISAYEQALEAEGKVIVDKAALLNLLGTLDQYVWQFQVDHFNPEIDDMDSQVAECRQMIASWYALFGLPTTEDEK